MIWVLITVALNVAAQIVLKGAASQTKSIDDVWPIWWQYALALGAYALSVVSWVLALRDLPLSVAYPFMAMAFVAVPLASILLFKESVTIAQWCFLGLLIVAVVGFALTSAPAVAADGASL
jgi:multidrug transporter EmrE-like cation transporter